MSIYKELFEIQQKLIVAKSQHNEFGKYNYRSAEDILESLKEVTKSAIHMTDEVALIGDRYYVKATVTMTNDKGESISSTAFAREEFSRKGMSADQLTGSCSSYARKYALNALFAIDDTKDADTLDNRHQLSKTEEEKAADELIEKTHAAMLELIDANDIAFIEVWAETDRDIQSACWKLLNTKQKKVSRELLDSVRKDET